MSADRRLMDALDGFARSLLPDAVLQQERATRSVINLDATVDADAIGQAVAIPIVTDHEGVVPVGFNICFQRRAWQALRLWYVWADLGTAPTGGEATFAVAIDGVQATYVTVQPGATAGVASASVDIPQGALITIDCLVANGAENLSMTLALRPRGD